MGCFFRCFRLRDANRPNTHLASKSIASKSRDPLFMKNPLASLLECEEKESSSCEKVGHLSLQVNFDKESADEELKREAHFLKSCDALLETPAEICKASKKTMVQSQDDSGVPSNFHSGTFCRKLWDEQPGQISDTPIEVHGDSHRQVNISEGCQPEEQQIQRKDVHFDEAKHTSGNESAQDYVVCDMSPQIKNQIHALGSDDSSYPTPVHLTGEVQTPGTVYPLNLQSGHDTRIRNRYINPLLNPVENSSQWMALRGRNSHLVKSSRQLEQLMGNSANSAQGEDNIQQISVGLVPRESSINGKNQNQEIIFKEEVNFNQDTPDVLVCSLSQWLKPPPPKADKWNMKDVSWERSRSGKSYVSDRPIIGTVAAHWNDDEPSHVTPTKWFAGNGIPNSTNKYKEDQKVSWHATPFEERLEKALSDEKLYPQRKLDGRPNKLDYEGEEIGTAAS